MIDMRKFLIDPTTENRLLTHGLTLAIGYDTGCESPFDWGSSNFVSDDNDLSSDIESGESFKEFVSNYCHEVLDCYESDILWVPVSGYLNGADGYALAPNAPYREFNAAGFIYALKSDIYSEHNVTRISPKLRETVLKKFAREIALYTAWTRNDVYTVRVESANQAYKETAGWITAINNDVDVTANDLIDDAIASMRYDQMCPTVIMQIDTTCLPADTSPTIYINEKVKSVFGGVLTFGDIVYRVNTGVLSAIVSLADIRSIERLSMHADPTFFKAISDKIKEFHLTGRYKEVSERDVQLTFTENVPYNEWEPVMIAGLMSVMLDTATCVDVVAVVEAMVDPRTDEHVKI